MTHDELKCSVVACSSSFDEYGSYNFNGTKVCGMCYTTFEWMKKSGYQLGLL
jgi:hypothetical protein